MLDRSTIETFDRNRRQFYRGYVFSFGLFFIVCITRLICKLSGYLPSWLDTSLFVALILSIVIQLYFFFRLSRLKAQAKQDPELKEILADELTQYHQMKAWKYAFLATVGSLFLIAMISAFVVPIHEITAILTPVLLTGAGAYHISFWWMEKE